MQVLFKNYKNDDLLSEISLKVLVFKQSYRKNNTTTFKKLKKLKANY